MEILKRYDSYLKSKHQNDKNKYILIVNNFLQYCKAQDIDYLQITFDEYTQYIVSIKERLQNSTMNRYITTMRSFYRYLQECGVDKNNRIEEIKKVNYFKLETKIYDRINSKELDKMMVKAVMYLDRICPYKFNAIFYFMFYTAIRKDEVVRLKRSDVDLKENSAIVRVPTKGKKERWVFFPKKVGVLLKKYFDRESEIDNAFNLTVFKIENYMTYLSKFSPKDRKVTLHTFRRSCAQMLYEKGWDILKIKEFLGHSSLQTTLRYIETNSLRLKQEYRKIIR